jgi:hypothetical protein
MASRISRAMSTAWSAGFSTGTGSLKTTIAPVAIRSTRLLPLPGCRVVPPNLHSMSPSSPAYAAFLPVGRNRNDYKWHQHFLHRNDYKQHFQRLLTGPRKTVPVRSMPIASARV